MITKFEDFVNETYNLGISYDTYNGPPLVTPKGDPGIGNQGGTNGGSIGGEFELTGDVTATPPHGGYKYNVTQVKMPPNKRKENALKKLKRLNILTFDKWLKKDN